MATCAPRSSVPYAASYHDLADPDTVACAQMGDRSAAERLILKYRNLVTSAARSFYIPGADRDDILQIGMIGLWQAIVDFRVERSASFPAFARVCIRRQLLTAIKTARRQKQAALNTSVSLDATRDTRRSDGAMACRSAVPDPEAAVITDAEARSLCLALRRRLSDFEWRVLGCFEDGLSYHEIATRLGCKVKSVDNALARVRRKAMAVRVANDVASGPAVSHHPPV